jgi:glutaredoxin
MSQKPILYIKPGCPWCLDALDFFSQSGIELDVQDVKANPAAMQRMVEISGQKLTPTLEYGDFIVADFSVNELLDKLNQAPAVRRELGLGDKADEAVRA